MTTKPISGSWPGGCAAPGACKGGSKETVPETEIEGH
jgi:hypothetical protein